MMNAPLMDHLFAGQLAGLVAVLAVCLFSIGCMDSISDKSLPAPLRETVGHTITGHVPRIHGGDHFEIGGVNGLHYVRMRGISCPKNGQKFFRKAWVATRKMTQGRKTSRVEVVDRDESMVEIADVFVLNTDASRDEEELNVALELLIRGLAWYDGTEFENASQYKQAQHEAQTSRVGLWSQEDPVAPWAFDSLQGQ